MTEEIRLLPIYHDAKLPTRGTPDSVGLDLYAYCISESKRPNKILIPPNATRNIPTGLRIEPPRGHYLMVCSRSGLAQKSIFVANAPGIIDPDYRGEIKVLLYNGSHESYYVEHEHRIAQMILAPILPTTIMCVEELSESERGQSGFGSTGA